MIFCAKLVLTSLDFLFWPLLTHQMLSSLPRCLLYHESSPAHFFLFLCITLYFYFYVSLFLGRTDQLTNRRTYRFTDILLKLKEIEKKYPGRRIHYSYLSACVYGVLIRICSENKAKIMVVLEMLRTRSRSAFWGPFFSSLPSSRLNWEAIAPLSGKTKTWWQLFRFVYDWVTFDFPPLPLIFFPIQQ